MGETAMEEEAGRDAGRCRWRRAGSGRARRLVLLALPVMLVATLVERPVQAIMAGQEPNAFEKSLDVAVLRPLGGARLVAGTALYLPVSFFNALGQSFLELGGAIGLGEGANWSIFPETFELLIAEPYRYMLVRPLGEDLAGS